MTDIKIDPKCFKYFVCCLQLAGCQEHFRALRCYAIFCTTLKFDVSHVEGDTVTQHTLSLNLFLLLALTAYKENFKALGAELLELSCTQRDTIPNNAIIL